MHEVPNRLGSTMMCLSYTSLSNTSHCNIVHHTVVNNECTILQGDDMHDNDDSPTSNVIDSDSNYLRDTSDSKIEFKHHMTDDIPVPPQFQIPSSCKLNMSPHELELMLFINKNFMSPSIFNKVMKWAYPATADGYKFDAPSYSTMNKQMNYTVPNTINVMVVLSNLRSLYQIRLGQTSQ